MIKNPKPSLYFDYFLKQEKRKHLLDHETARSFPIHEIVLFTRWKRIGYGVEWLFTLFIGN